MACQCKTDSQRKKCIWWVDGEGLPPEQNIQTGELRATKGCFPEVALRWLVDVSRTNSQAAASIQSNRNVVANGLSRLIGAVSDVDPRTIMPHLDDEPLQLPRHVPLSLTK